MRPGENQVRSAGRNSGQGLSGRARLAHDGELCFGVERLRQGVADRERRRDHEQPNRLAQPDVTVTKRVEYRSVAVEAVLVSNGTVIGPFMSGVNGRPELHAVPGRLVR